MAEENIKTSKIVYGAQSANEFIDRSFTELFKTKDPVNISRFFSMYDDLFYNIPKTGDQSHTTLINKSQDYVNNYQNPLQVEVDSLREEVIRLTEQLNETIEENPFYPNGTVLSRMKDDGDPQAHDIYYMDRGLARRLVGMYNDDVFLALKASLGFPSTTPFRDVVLAVPQSIIDGLNKGPRLDIEDIAYPGAQNVERRLEENIAQQNQASVDNITSNSWWNVYFNSGVGYVNVNNLLDNGLPSIRNAIRNAWNQERQIEALRNEYLLDIKNGYTEEERTNGQFLLDQLLGNISSTGRGSYNKLNAIRDTVVRYRRMWEILQNGSTSLITDIKMTVNNDVSNEERSEFEGKWKDENFQEFFPGINLNDKEVERVINATAVQGSLEDTFSTPIIQEYGSTQLQNEPPSTNNPPGPGGPPNIGQGQ